MLTAPVPTEDGSKISWQMNWCKKSGHRYEYAILCKYRNITNKSNRVRGRLASICSTSKVNICSEVKLDLLEQLWQLILLLSKCCPVMGTNISPPYYVNGCSLGSCVVVNWHFTWLLRPQGVGQFSLTKTGQGNSYMQKHCVEIGKIKRIIWIDFKCSNKHYRSKDSEIRKNDDVASLILCFV